MKKPEFQRGANIPMTTETYKRLSLPLRMAVEALITHPTVETYNQITRRMATLVRCNLAGEAMELGNDALSDICDGFEATGAITVTDFQAEHLRLAIDSIDRALPLVPVNQLRQAVAEVEVFCASVGA